MTAIAQDYGLMFQLRNDLYSQLETPLKNALEALCNDIKTLLLSDKKIERQSDEVLAQIFDFGIKAAKWLSVHADKNVLELMENVVPQIEALGENPQLETLTENILFALRCRKRVAEGIIKMQNAYNQENIYKDNHKNNQPENTSNVSGFEALNITHYNDLKLLLESFDAASAEKVMTFVNASLNIE